MAGYIWAICTCATQGDGEIAGLTADVAGTVTPQVEADVLAAREGVGAIEESLPCR